MTARVGAPRLEASLLMGTAMVLVVGAATALAGRPALTRDRAFVIDQPRDGAQVSAGFLLSWEQGAHAAAEYAVVVDGPLPAPGSRVTPGPHTMVLAARRLVLTIGRASSGSPSARGYHTLQVVRLRADGRRDGEDVAVVHVRSRP